MQRTEDTSTLSRTTIVIETCKYVISSSWMFYQLDPNLGFGGGSAVRASLVREAHTTRSKSCFGSLMCRLLYNLCPGATSGVRGYAKKKAKL